MDKSKKQVEKSKGDILNDPRFSHLVTDPRFNKLPHHERKVKIDKRFQSMFNDDKFKLKYTVDKYGRRVNNTTSEDLKKYYELDSDAEEEIEKEERRQEEIQIVKNSDDDSDSEDDISENDQLGDDGEVLPKQIKAKLINSDIDYARGEGRILSDSSSDEESSSDDDDSEIFIEHVWGELDADADTTDESTKRLAACNMDWDRIRASDILVLCTSFLPPGGSILSVKIYPSDFGKERLRDEEINGPQELVTKTDNLKNNDDKNSTDSDDDLVKDENSDLEEGDDYHMEKLRQYQLNRLKYYYAVIECDSIKTADKIYKECDGLEYESTATKLDLRFIPNDEEFNDKDIKDICTELPDLNKYKPRMFTTTALQQAKVELTWDETNVERRELSDKLASGKLDDVSDADLRKFVAYSSEEDCEDEENLKSESDNEENENVKVNDKEYISKYSNLLNEILEKEKEKKNNRYEMEYTWGINVNSNKLMEKTVEQKSKKDLTPIEKALEKKKEKNKRRKDERKKRAQQRDGNFDENSNNDNDDDIPDCIDLNDPYFAEEFANGDFEPIKNLKTKKSNKSKIKNDSDDENSKELELLLEDGSDDKKHFSLDKIMKTDNETKSNKKRKHKLNKSKKKIDEKLNIEEDNFQIDTKDERFGAIYKSHLYNIDPTDSHFKKTKGMEEIIKEKLKRKNEIDENTNNEEIIENKKSKKQIENQILVTKLRNVIRGQNIRKK